MAGLKLENVCKRYGAVQVIENLSLDVAQGEFVVFLGPSGCGKTSLLRMIAGLEEVTGGRILIGDHDVTAAAPGQRNLAMVFQHYALYPHMSVRDNLAFGLKNIGIPADEIARRITESARMLELDALLERKPGQLSGGQRQRVAIGRAVVKEPGIFLFDEPLSNLDAALRGRTRLELAQLHQRLGATMVFVTHDQIEAMTLATRIVVMKGGAIEQVATPTELYRRPATRFVASFIGTPGMGFVPVQRAGDEQGRAVVTVPGGQNVATRVAAEGLPAQGLVLGVRPENLSIGEQGPLRGRVQLVEFLGERTLAHLKLEDGSPLIVTVPAGASPKPGSHVAVSVDVAEAHLFDEAGRAHHAQEALA
ncbi:ABC transporter ATP-binding protein [Roseateles saccharophilus]|uniref:Carbohydrate ABC transporter ATP-binding protein (CUT1 family) n=1 Tax=Roseateles saccharophilus TaxID=304 RepID=A0A4R3UIR5_ROSSA|nr:sn-glycerol-3-phosphate ABC transporter ATP-binding protein UgpC [Roseateles saccharophilus]MDG0834828.1 sn-glycerol-3-phosphate ABC transporter ATP-binding protein UgpC [Roseateles saccharophilus]TCU88951.1 carbohydrate ABC transporter ATP-binding protein (CUT1 family) [Roseateles saccharophilus]